MRRAGGREEKREQRTTAGGGLTRAVGAPRLPRAAAATAGVHLPAAFMDGGSPRATRHAPGRRAFTGAAGGRRGRRRRIQRRRRGRPHEEGAKRNKLPRNTWLGDRLNSECLCLVYQITMKTVAEHERTTKTQAVMYLQSAIAPDIVDRFPPLDRLKTLIEEQTAAADMRVRPELAILAAYASLPAIPLTGGGGGEDWHMSSPFPFRSTTARRCCGPTPRSTTPCPPHRLATLRGARELTTMVVRRLDKRGLPRGRHIGVRTSKPIYRRNIGPLSPPGSCPR